MSDSVRVSVVAPDGNARTAVETRLSEWMGTGTTVTAVATVDDVTGGTDCIVGVADENAAAFAEMLTNRTTAPVVMFGASEEPATDVLAAGATDVVQRETDDSVAVLANRVRRLASDGDPVATPDGGGAATAGSLPDHAGDPLERMTDGFVSLDTDWRVIYSNEAGREMLGDAGTDLVGRNVWEVFPDEDTQLREHFERAMESGEVATVEEYDPGRDRWFEVRVYPAEEGLSVFFRDVTEQKRARQQLAASEQSLQQLHDLASDGDLSRTEKIERMLAAGRERLGVDLGFLTRIEDGRQEIVQAVGDHPQLQPGASAPLSEAYCRHTIGREEPLSVVDAAEEGWEDDPAYERFGLACYVGATIVVDGKQYGTVCFADTDPRPFEFTESERTFVDLVTDWISYVLEQRQYEAQLRANQRRLETVVENIPVVVFALDPDGTYTLARGRGLEALGFEPGQAVGESVFDLYSDYPEIIEYTERALDGETTHHTVEMDDDVTLEIWYQPVVENGEVTQVVGVVRDISELAAHRERLSGLLETTRSLMQARDREEVADLAATAAQDVLGFHLNVVRLYDAETDTLEPAGTTAVAEAHMGERPVYEVGEGMPGEVFATGESRVIDDVSAADVDIEADNEMGSALYYPVGVHGTISVGATEPDAFDETDEQALALLATAAAAACTRAKREREVREAREHVETVLERINGLIENTIEVLVEATTREELEAGVVDQLAGADPYTFAWMGRPDLASETLSPTAWNGTASISVENARFDLGGESAVATALREGEPQVVDVDDQGADDLGCCAGTDAETCIVVPLAYKDTTYGVVAVFADEPGAFDEREQVVLSALGRAVANATNAVERGRILDATEVIELEFAIDDADLLFSTLSRGGDCTVESAGIDYRADGTLRLYLTSEDGDGERLVDLAESDETVTDARLITDHDEGCLLELTVEESLVARMSEYGAVVRSVVAEGGTARFTVELPYESEARELFELVEERYPGTDLVGYHEHERPVQTRQEFRAALADRFTDRQETALRTAFLGGFFDWPREIDGNELAEAMDISRPTYHQHLRAAQRKVLEELFEGSASQ